jgi:4-amino-4-deoxy-L-arabinose transferase-like glycosyltransferase
MPSLTFFKQRILLIMAIAAFIVARAPKLFVAFYWDESWPYATAIRRMHDHGASLLPTALHPDYSRGHPLLFHASAASWMKIFGVSHAGMHSFSLFISVCFLVLVYEAGLRMFNVKVAALAVILLMTQMIFYVQSTYLLPDMTSAFLAFAALYVYANTNKFVLKAVLLAALFLTKETGLYTGVIIGMDGFMRLFTSKATDGRRKWHDFAAISFAVLAAGIFFLLQKQVRGWYLYPAHMGLMQHTWGDIYWHFRWEGMGTLFKSEYRYLIYYMLLSLGAVAAVMKKRIGYLVPLLPGLLVFLMLDDRTWILAPNYVYFGLLALTLFYATYVLCHIFFKGQDDRKRYIFLLTACFFSHWFFSAWNIMLPRYLLTCMGFSMFLLAIYFDRYISVIHKYLLYPIMGCILFVCYYASVNTKGGQDTWIESFDALEVQEKVVDYLEDQDYYKLPIRTTFLRSIHLVDPYTGFLTKGKTFTAVQEKFDEHTRLVVLDNIEWNGELTGVQQDTSFHLLKRISKNNQWAEIYIKNNLSRQ